MIFCDGCNLCLKACPYSALEVKKGKAEVLERCTSCGACLEVCKKKALVTDAKPREIPDFSGHRGIWVFAEQRDGQLNRVSLELLGKANQLGNELNQEVSAVLIGHHVSDLADTLIRYGADRVYLAENRLLKGYRTLAYTKVVEELIRKYRPNIFLMGASHIGQDLAPRVSRRVGAGLTADCTDLSIDSKEGILLQTRPAFGGNVMAIIVSRYSRPQMATVRPGIMEAIPLPDHKGRIIKQPISLSEKEIGLKVLNIAGEEKKAGQSFSCEGDCRRWTRCRG